jgi:hypothetical protein
MKPAAKRIRRKEIRLQLAALRRLTWNWDPLGLAGSGCPLDEYDALVNAVYSLLSRGCSQGELLDCMRSSCIKEFGIGGLSVEKLMRHGEIIRLWYATVINGRE